MDIVAGYQACHRHARGTLHCFVKWEDKIISCQVAQEARKYHLAIGSHFSNNFYLAWFFEEWSAGLFNAFFYVMKYRYNHPHLLWHCLVNKRKTLIAGLLLDANKNSCHMTKQSLFYFSFTVPGQVKCFNKMYRGHRGQLFMNKHKWYLIKIIIYAVWRNLLLQCVVTIFCIDLSSSDMFTGSFTTPREETVFGSVKSACCLFANEERNQEKDSWKV